MVGAQHLKPVVVRKNREPELSCILANLFKMCPKQSCFSDCWKVSLVAPLFKNVGAMSTATGEMRLFF